MLLPWVRVLLGREHTKRAYETDAGFGGFDHVINVAALGSDEWICEAGAVLVCQLFFPCKGGRVAAHHASVGDLFFEDNFYCAFWSHHSNLGGGPGVIYVAANVLGIHDIVSAAI